MVDTKALRQQQQLLKEQRKANDMMKQQNRLIAQQNKMLGNGSGGGMSGQGGVAGAAGGFLDSMGKIAGAVGGALGETLSELKEDFRTSTGGIMSDHVRSEIARGQLGTHSQNGARATGGTMGESYVPRSGPINLLHGGVVWTHLMNPGKPKVQLDCYAHATSPESLAAYLADLAKEENYPFTAAIITINLGGTDADKKLLEDFLAALATHPNLYGAVGYGPRNLVEDMDALDEHLTSLLNTQPKLIALGPVGLDVPYAAHTLPQQQAQLAMQLDIAADFGLPVFLRNLSATSQLKQVMDGQETKPPAIIYTRPFTTLEEKELILAHDMHILLRSEATWPDQSTYRQNIFNIPKLRWLLASGNGLTASESRKGQMNTSASLPDILTVVSENMQQDVETVLGTLNANAFRLFYREE